MDHLSEGSIYYAVLSKRFARALIDNLQCTVLQTHTLQLQDHAVVPGV